MNDKGKVYLVGAGPGSPGLLTLRGRECLELADVVLYDSLAPLALLNYAPREAEKILVGKRHGRVHVDQEEIESMLIAFASAGKQVVRLKGGDPYVFGRGGEEAEACANAGIEFEVVSGVSSAVAVPAFAGVPLTHRDHASSVTIITGQPRAHRRDKEIDAWVHAARAGGTLVFLMAVLKVEELAKKMLDAGLSEATPVIAVRWGTTAKQKTLRTTLGRLAGAVQHENLRPPVVFVVGEVARFSSLLAWYERLPLFGQRVVVTRASHQAHDLGNQLARHGAEPIYMPVIDVVPPSEKERTALHKILRQVSEFDWLILTSVNGVRRFFGELAAAKIDIRELAGVHVAAIGPATRKEIETRGIVVEAEPNDFRAEGLIEVLGDPSGQSYLLARAAKARDLLPDTLRHGGGDVTIAPLYETVRPAEVPLFSELGKIDVVTFTSSSTVENFVECAAGRPLGEVFDGVVVAAIGPVTAAALERQGVSADVVPKHYTISALVAALVEFFANRRSVQ